MSAVAQKVRVVVVEADRGDLDLVAPIADPGFVVPAFLGPRIRIAGTGRRETARHTCQQYGITQLVGGAKTWQPLIDIGLTDTCRPIRAIRVRPGIVEPGQVNPFIPQAGSQCQGTDLDPVLDIERDRLCFRFPVGLLTKIGLPFEDEITPDL